MIIQNKNTKTIHIGNNGFPICEDFSSWDKTIWEKYSTVDSQKNICEVCKSIRRHGKITLTFYQEPTFTVPGLITITKKVNNKWEVLLTGKDLELQLSNFIGELL